MRTRDLKATGLLLLGAALLLPAVTGSDCRWREGNRYPIPAPDIPDVDIEPTLWVDPPTAYGYITSAEADVVVVDVRPEEECQTGRIPTAWCNPFVEGAFAQELDVEDELGYLILYDADGSLVEQVLEVLPEYERRQVLLIENGFGAYAAWGDLPIEG